MDLFAVGAAGDAAAVADGEDEFLSLVGVAGCTQGEVGPFGVEDGGQDFGVGGEFGDQSGW